jgi:single-stranded-DNA-specific exonuclease
MLSITKRWLLPESVPQDIDHGLLEFHPVLRQILYNRGYQTAEQARQFLAAQPPSGSEPFNMLGVASATERIQAAIQHSEQIAIYGDYDADGVTATALLVQLLKRLGADVRGYIPNRFDEGYGLNNDALSLLKDEGVSLIVTVDCGIRSLPEAEHAKKIGLDLIITDHHHPAEELPIAEALVNPKQPGDHYPDKNLAGVGLAYKLACGLIETSHYLTEKITAEDTFLDLVALGTITDLAPLTGENRSLVRSGLQYIRRPTRQGIQALIGVAGLRPASISSGDVSFFLGPRLNAAGRLESALAAFNLLMAQDISTAAMLAQRLEIQNRERQEITRQLQIEAEQIALKTDAEPLILFAVHPDFNPGVVGLVASRLTEQYYRPSIVGHYGPEFTRASCRSISEFHITSALDECAELLEHHGGHAAAAGFTVRNSNLPTLLERLREIARRDLSHQDLRPTLVADTEISLSDLKPELLRYLEWLQPTGMENRQPMFISRGLKVLNARGVGKDNAHLKLAVTDGRITYDAIGFRMGSWLTHLPQFVDLIYHFESNEYNGQVKLQLNVRDLKPSS